MGRPGATSTAAGQRFRHMRTGRSAEWRAAGTYPGAVQAQRAWPTLGWLPNEPWYLVTRSHLWGCGNFRRSATCRATMLQVERHE